MITLAVTNHRVPLTEMKERVRALATGGPLEPLEGDEHASEVYEAHDMCIRYQMRCRRLRGQLIWKGRWMVGWTPIGENHLFGRLDRLEGLR